MKTNDLCERARPKVRLEAIRSAADKPPGSEDLLGEDGTFLLFMLATRTGKPIARSAAPATKPQVGHDTRD